MSLILEALRKSEAERRRDSAPDVALELPPAPARSAPAAPAWLWPLLAATVALAVLGWWGASRIARSEAGPASTPAVRETQTPAPEDAGLPRIVPHAAPAATTAPSRPQGMQPEVAIQAPAPQPEAAPVARAKPAFAAPATSMAPAAPAPSAAPDIAATALPPVKLSMHMWDADPARRFVILDGQRMGEGDRSGGLSVIAIDRTGVVVERDGQRAHVALP